MTKVLKQFDEDPERDRTNCPNCGEAVRTDAILCRFCDTGLSREHFKECNSCAEMIRVNATICRFCKTNVFTERDNQSIELRSIGNQTTPEIAQSLCREIIEQLQRSSDYASILQSAVENLRVAANADRVVIWQVVGDRLDVTSEAAISNRVFTGNKLGAQESTAIVFEFLSRFPDDSGSGVISVANTNENAEMHMVSPTLASLIELGGVQSRLMVQLRAQGVFLGFVETQQCGRVREWTREEAWILQQVAQVLSLVIQQSADRSVIESHGRETKLLDQIAGFCRDTVDWLKPQPLFQVTSLVAEHMGFSNSQIFFYDETAKALKPQFLSDRGGFDKEISVESNPFMHVFRSGRGRVFNVEFTRKGDEFFGHETAMIFPLIARRKCFGVIAWWGLRDDASSRLRTSERTFAQAVSSIIAQALYIDRSGA